MAHILYPGSFKPVHPGHIFNIMHYAVSRKNDVHIIISRSDRDFVTAKSSLNFLSYVCGSVRSNVTIEVTDERSPIYAAYNATGSMKYGAGEYMLLTSDKDDDYKRSEDYFKAYSKGGKYYTDGVVPVLPERTSYAGNDGIVYSATDVRDIVRNGDEEEFVRYYARLIKNGFVTENDIRSYYEELTDELSASFGLLGESSSVTHIPHPYEYTDMTFAELKDMVRAVSSGSVSGMSEKIDGVNLMFSVNSAGIIEFARNRSQMIKNPVSGDEIRNNARFEDIGISTMMGNAVDGITDAVDSLGSKAVGLFNRVAGSTISRVWINSEVVSEKNSLVISYDGNFVSMHGGIKVEYDRNGNILGVGDCDDVTCGKLIDELCKASESSDSIMRLVKTPEVSIDGADGIADKTIGKIDSLMRKYSLMDDSTIGDMQRVILKRTLAGIRDFAIYDGDIMNELVYRWTYGKKGKTLQQVLKGKKNSAGHEVGGRSLKYLQDFEKFKLPGLMEGCMTELKMIIADFGNEIITRMHGGIGGSGRGTRGRLTGKIEKERKDVIDGYSIGRMENLDRNSWAEEKVGELGGSEGIVFTYNGRKMKLTGYYTPIKNLAGIGVNR